MFFGVPQQRTQRAQEHSSRRKHSCPHPGSQHCLSSLLFCWLLQRQMRPAVHPHSTAGLHVAGTKGSLWEGSPEPSRSRDRPHQEAAKLASEASFTTPGVRPKANCITSVLRVVFSRSSLQATETLPATLYCTEVYSLCRDRSSTLPIRHTSCAYFWARHNFFHNHLV